MLRLAEELLYFALLDDHGETVTAPDHNLRCALAGSVLMDLALEGRIDSDPERLFVVDATPVGDDLLDPSLAMITAQRDSKDAGYWVDRLAATEIADEVRDRAISRLVERGVLEKDDGGMPSVTRRVLRARRYPGVSGPAGRDANLRIMGVIFNDDVPHPRDAMLIAIVDACGLLGPRLSTDERVQVAERLDLIRRLDLVGRAVLRRVEGGRDPDRAGSRRRTLTFVRSLVDGLRGSVRSVRFGVASGVQELPGLRFAEEVLLFLLDKQTGHVTRVPDRSLRYVLAGAVLMDLALEDRIDTDIERLVLVDPTPVGDDLLDPSLAMIAEDDETRDAAQWVDRIARSEIVESVREGAIERLIERRILEGEAGGFLSLTRWVARARRYPRVSGPAGREVEGRIMGILFAEDVPEPRDAMLIALFDACRIFDRVLSPEERANVADRIDLLGRLDLIGRSVSDAIRTAEVRGPAPSPERAKSISNREALAKALARIPVASGGLPVLGNGLSLATDYVHFLTRQYRLLGPVFRIRTPLEAFTVLAGPEANSFLRREGRLHLRSFGALSPLARRLGAHRLVVNMDGSEHFRIRKALSNGYSKNVILARLEDAARIAERAVSAWPQGKAFSVLPELQTMMTEQISQLCAGATAAEWMDDLTYYLDRVLVSVGRAFPEFLLRTPRYRRARDRMDRLASTILKAHDPELRAGMEPDLIDDLLRLHRADPQFLPENDLGWASLGPFLAGLHTAANVAAFMLHALIKDPEGQTAVRIEADQLFAGEGPTPEKLRTMDVTHRFAMETLRLHPVAPTTLRDVVNSFEFAGYEIPVGSKIMFAFAVPHFCAEHYPDPLRFDIDRYLPDRNEHRVPDVYAPFGIGTHRCLGNRFAEVQIALTISVVLHRVDLALDPPDFELKPRHWPVSSPGNAFKIKIAHRR